MDRLRETRAAIIEAPRIRVRIAFLERLDKRIDLSGIQTGLLNLTFRGWDVRMRLLNQPGPAVAKGIRLFTVLTADFREAVL